MKLHLSFCLGSLFSAALLFMTPSNLQAAPTAGTGKYFKGPMGLQLYSLRDQFKKDVPGTLALVQKLGFKNVELAGTYDQSPAQFKAQLEAHGLTPISGHFPFE